MSQWKVHSRLFWEPFYRAEPAPLARAHRPSFPETLKSDGNSKFVNLNGKRLHQDDEMQEAKGSNQNLPCTSACVLWRLNHPEGWTERREWVFYTQWASHRQQCNTRTALEPAPRWNFSFGEIVSTFLGYSLSSASLWKDRETPHSPPSSYSLSSRFFTSHH